MLRSKNSETSDLPRRLKALGRAADIADGRLGSESVDLARSVEAKATERLKHGSTHTLVAFLGSTGSGKSSLTNAVVGTEVATTGLRRPTTSTSLACIWGDDDASNLLDWLEVPNRYLVNPADAESDLDGLVLLDVPDHDSVAVSHRLEMERAAEYSDLLIWVTDHEKYADRAMHDYLKDLNRHGAVVAMVLNKRDQLSPEDQKTTRDDLIRLLQLDGLVSPTVLTVSATTGEGVDDLRELLIERVSEQRAMVQRLAADVSVACQHLWSETGTEETPDVSARQKKELDRSLVDSTGIGVVADAVAAGYKRDASARTGWPFTRWVRQLRPHPLRKLHLGDSSAGRSSLPAPSGAQQARASASIRHCADEVTKDLAEPWPRLVRDAATPDPEILNDRLDLAIGDAVRQSNAREPRWWAVVGTLQVAMALAAIVGAVWLAVLAVLAYLQLPEPPTPAVEGIPVPTGLLVGGLLTGWLLAVISRRFAGVGAKRRARGLRSSAASEVSEVSAGLVVKPMQDELDARRHLQHLLGTAEGR